MKLKGQVEIVLTAMITILSVLAGVFCFRAYHEKPDWSKVPTMSVAELITARQEITTQIANPTNVEDYFKILVRLSVLQKAAEKQEVVGAGLRELQSNGVCEATFSYLENEFVKNWQSTHVGKDITAYSLAHQGETDKYLMTLPTMPNEEWKIDHFWFVAKCWYLFPLPLCIALFVLRIREEGGSVLLEVCSLRLVVSSIFWMFGIPYYRNMNFVHQIKRCQQLASFLLISSISCFAGSKKTEVKAASENSTGTGNSFSVSGTTAVLNEYIGTNGVAFHRGPVQQSTITATMHNGVYFGAFGSVPLGVQSKGENFGYEHDLTIGFSKTVRTINLDMNATYVNLEPISQLRGDPLGLTLMLNKSFKLRRVGLAPYFDVDHYTLILGHNSPKRGTFNRFGVSGSLPVGKFSVASNLEFLKDTGAFGNTPSTWLVKGGMTLSHPLGQHLQFSLPIHVYDPMTHVHDGRKFEATFGFKIAYAFR